MIKSSIKNQMHLTKKGWVVINIGHMRTGSAYIVTDTFHPTRTASVKSFMKHSAGNWSYWRKKFNFRVVRSTQIILV